MNKGDLIWCISKPRGYGLGAAPNCRSRELIVYNIREVRVLVNRPISYRSLAHTPSLSSATMPPAQPAIATQPLSEGKLVLKRQKHSYYGQRLVVYRISMHHKYSPKWLLGNPEGHLDDLLTAHLDLARESIGHDFVTKLLGGTLRSNAYLLHCIHETCSLI